jgi:hypothetical protein
VISVRYSVADCNGANTISLQEVAAAQFMLGLAHLEGRGADKDDRVPYHWQRLAEMNSSHLFEQSRSEISELRSRIPPQGIASNGFPVKPRNLTGWRCRKRRQKFSVRMFAHPASHIEQLLSGYKLCAQELSSYCRSGVVAAARSDSFDGIFYPDQLSE